MAIKLCTRRLRSSWCQMRRYFKCKIVIIAVALALVTTTWLFSNNIVVFSSGQQSVLNHCQPIDVVYTWVNGSDPEFIAAAQSYAANLDPARFDDKNELRYSLRSLEKHAPWVRHVYIVTNGQIPYWLDLSYDKVTIVPHEVLAPQAHILPTFSSAAIETFLHHIPQLSERFLYLNDDIFLGAPLYPEDLYTQADGVRIYQAWLVPDCATDCPWTYIGDGACDQHCNIAACQYDGNDCVNVVNEIDPSAENGLPPAQSPKPLNEKSNRLAAPSFREFVRQRNTTALYGLWELVAKYNQRLQHVPRLNTSSTTPRAGTPKPSSHINSTKDIYSQSLIQTNMLLNRYYGFKARHVLAHVGFLLERSIVDAMQAKFAKAVNRTAAQRVRAADDLQFAFAYYTFLMSESRQATVAEIFDEFDTDQSGTWSDREVRTFLVRMYPLPLDWSAVRYFEEVTSNCSRDLGANSATNNIVYSTLVYERYEDSNLPTITRELVQNCPLLAEAMTANFGVRPKYKYHINSKRDSHSNFMMLTSNITDVVDALDRLRLHPRCVRIIYIFFYRYYKTLYY